MIVLTVFSYILYLSIWNPFVTGPFKLAIFPCFLILDALASGGLTDLGRDTLPELTNS